MLCFPLCLHYWFLQTDCLLDSFASPFNFALPNLQLSLAHPEPMVFVATGTGEVSIAVGLQFVPSVLLTAPVSALNPEAVSCIGWFATRSYVRCVILWWFSVSV